MTHFNDPERRERDIAHAEAFEHFKEELRATPESEIIGLLDTEIWECSEYLNDCLDSRRAAPEEKLLATHGLAVAIMAKAPLVGVTEDFSYAWRGPAWVIDLARSEIAEFVAIDPEDRLGMYGTEFFEADPSALNRFDRQINYSIMPAGEYDDHAFAAGVALGEVRAYPSF